MVQLITLGHHLGDERRGRIERRSAGATVVHLSLSDLIDHGSDVVGVFDLDLDGVDIIIECDRTDRIGSDLGLIGDITTIANEDRTRDFLVQHDAHLLLQPCDDVEARDVDNIIAIELLLLVHGLRRGDTLEDIEDLIDLTLVVVSIERIASSTSLVGGDISIHRLDAGERNVLGVVEHSIHPLGATTVEIRRVADCLRIREENIDVRDAIVLRVADHRIGETTVAASVGEDGVQFFLNEFVGVADFGVFVGFERIVHTIVSFGLFNFFTRVAFGGHTDQRVHNLLLNRGKRIENILNGHVLFVLVVLCFFCHRCFLSFGFFRGIGMGEFLTTEDDHFIVQCGKFLTMSNGDVVDERSRISPRKHKAYFANIAMLDQTGFLPDVIRVDGHCINIAMSNRHLCVLSGRRIIEHAKRIDAIRSILKLAVPKNIRWIGMIMLPYERNRGSVVFDEGILHDGSTIAASDTVSGSITTEIVFHIVILLDTFHFEVSPHFGCWRIAEATSFASVATLFFAFDIGALFGRHGIGGVDVRIAKSIRIRIIGLLAEEDRPHLIGTQHLHCDELLRNIRKILNSGEFEWISEEADHLTLGPRCFGEERPGKRIANGGENRFQCSVVVPNHLFFRGGAIGDGFGNAELTIQHRGEVLDLTEEIVLHRSIQLSDSLSGVGVGNPVLAVGQLLFNGFSTIFRLFLSGVGTNGIRKLNDQIQFSGSRLLVNHIEERQLFDESL